MFFDSLHDLVLCLQSLPFGFPLLCDHDSNELLIVVSVVCWQRGTLPSRLSAPITCYEHFTMKRMAAEMWNQWPLHREGRETGVGSWEMRDAGWPVLTNPLDSGPTREFSVCANYNNRYPLPSHQASHLHMRFFLIFWFLLGLQKIKMTKSIHVFSTI